VCERGTFCVRPEVEDAREDVLEFLKVGGLLEISVRTKPVCLENVLIQCGTGEHDDRNNGALGIIPQPLKDLEAIHVGHFQIHQDNIGGLTAGVAERWLSFEVGDEFASVTHNVQRPDAAAFGQSHFQKIDVGWSILGTEDIQFPFLRRAHPHEDRAGEYGHQDGRAPHREWGKA
jgi:hypothetical protein